MSLKDMVRAETSTVPEITTQGKQDAIAPV